MKTYIFHYPQWYQVPDGTYTYRMKEYRTKALNRQEAEIHFWSMQKGKKVRYASAEVIENRKRVQI